MESPAALALRPARNVLGMGRRVVTWPVTSQHGARRNAMVAATEIRRRRREQFEVEAFLAAHRPRRASSAAALG